MCVSQYSSRKRMWVLAMASVATFGTRSLMATTVTYQQNANGQAYSDTFPNTPNPGTHTDTGNYPNNNNWSQSYTTATDSYGDVYETAPSNWSTATYPNSSSVDVDIPGLTVALNLGVSIGNLEIDSHGAINMLAGNNLTVYGSTITDNGSIIVNSNHLSAGTNLTFDNASALLTGSGTITLNDSGSNAQIATGAGDTLTQDINHTINGQGTITAALTNNGTVSANIASDTLEVEGSTTNNGTLEALNGGTLSLFLGGVSGSGVITTDTGNSSRVTQLNATITGNTIAGELQPNGSSTNILSGVTVSSTGVVDEIDAEERVTGGLTLNGTINITAASYLGFGVTASENLPINSTGQIVFDSNTSNHISLDNGVALTIGSGITIHGQNGTIGNAIFTSPTGTIINNGIIEDDVTGGTITLQASTTNDGTLQALHGGTLALAGAISGTGVITTDTGNSSRVTQQGVTITGNTIAGELQPNGTSTNKLSGVTVSSTGVVDMSDADERVTGGLTLNGTINVKTASYLGFGVANNEIETVNSSDSGQTGYIDFDGNTGNRISLDNGVTLTVGPNIVIEGQNGSIGTAVFVSPMGTLINDGIIEGNVANGSLHLNAGTTNNGTIEALDGGTFEIDSTTVSGSGIITTDTGNGSKIVQNTTTITGNTISGELQPTDTSTNVLSGVTVTSTGVVDMSDAEERVTGGLTLNGTINLKTASDLGFGVAASESETVNSSGSGHTGYIDFDGNTSNRLSLDNGVTLTVGPNIIIQGQNGSIGTAIFVSPTGTLINDGTIEANVLGGTLHINPGSTIDNGTIEALNGGTISLDGGTISGTGILTTDTGNGSQIVQDVATLNSITIAGLITYLNNSNNVLKNVTISSTGTVSGNDAEERVTGGLVLNGAIDIRGSSYFSFGITAGETTNVTGAGQIIFDSNANNHISLDNSVNLIIDSGITIHGQNGSIGTAVFVSPTGTITNNGTIADDVSGGTITLQSGATNNGLLLATNGGTLTVAANALTNLSGNTLTGGTYEVDANSKMNLPNNVTTNAAKIILGGAGYTFSAISPLATNTGTFTVTNSAVFASAGAINNSGLVNVGKNATLTITGALTNTGLVNVVGGTLHLNQGMASGTVLSQLQSAYAHGAWNGVSGITSTLAEADTHHATAVGYTKSGTAYTLLYTWLGDTNLDGSVDSTDLSAISTTGSTWSTGDFNYDGKVDADDYTLFMLGAAESNGANISTTLPEPSILLASIFCIAFYRSRQRERI